VGEGRKGGLERRRVGLLLAIALLGALRKGLMVESYWRQEISPHMRLLHPLVLIVLAGCAAAKEPPSGGCIDLDWLRPKVGIWVSVDGQEVRSNDPALERFYPDRARSREIQGEAVLHCVDAVCTVLEEKIADKSCDEAACFRPDTDATQYGFGEFAERAVRLSRLAPAQGAAQIKVTFKITGPSPGWETCPF
jgi:hypothetical protein